METGYVVALAIAVPVILFPAAFVWYLNVGGITAALRAAITKKVAQAKAVAVK